MWFEPLTAWVVALLTTGVPMLGEKLEKTIPAEYWANKELKNKDISNGVLPKEIIRRAEQGRYYIPKEIALAYPTPHRGTDGKIIIENCELYNDDVKQYGAYEAQQWVKQGKYNLNEEQLKITHLQYEKKSLRLYSYGSSNNKEYTERIKEIDNILKSATWDYRKTEAVLQWQRAHDAESKYY